MKTLGMAGTECCAGNHGAGTILRRVLCGGEGIRTAPFANRFDRDHPHGPDLTGMLAPACSDGGIGEKFVEVLLVVPAGDQAPA